MFLTTAGTNPSQPLLYIKVVYLRRAPTAEHAHGAGKDDRADLFALGPARPTSSVVLRRLGASWRRSIVERG